MTQRTLAIIKPDAVLRRFIGHILTKIELEGFEIVDMQMVRLTKEQAKELYKVHKDKPFYEGQDVIKRYRKLMGATDYKKAEPYTIRYELATDIRHNTVHGSDSEETANFEIDFFKSLHNWTTEL
jgi:nucleoside-diphosphate kinase